MKKVSIITVNFNQAAVTGQFLASVETCNDYEPAEVIVVDNGSETDHTKKWKDQYRNVRFIRSERNLGFAGGNNSGIKVATGDYFFLVNNDTEFTDGLIESLVNILDNNPDVGAVSPKIRYFEKPEIIQYAGFSSMNFNTGRNKCIGQFEKDHGQYDRNTGPTAYVHGAAMMVRKEVIDKAGPMPENFFLYYEEMDWCEKIRRSGYQVWFEPKALIYHKESVSVGKESPLKEYFMTRNRILFIRRNAPAFSRILFFLHFFLLVSPRNLLNYIIEQRPDLRKQFFRAIWWNFRNGKESTVLGYELN